METPNTPQAGKGLVDALGGSEEALRQAIAREEQWQRSEEQSHEAYEAEMADAHMLMIWGGIGLLAGCAVGLHFWHLGMGFTVLSAMCTATITLTLAAVIAALKRRTKHRAS